MTNNEMPDEIYVGKDGWFSIQDDGAEISYTRTDLVIRKDDAVFAAVENRLSHVNDFLHKSKTDQYGRFKFTKAGGEHLWFEIAQALAQLQKLRGG